MWVRYTVILLLFYLFALLQNSFFTHFNLWGAVPNLVFIFFILLCFFAREEQYYLIVFYAIAAGLLLDVFSSSYIGVSAALLVAIGFGIKRGQALLFEGNDRKSLLYFLAFFLVSFTVYDFIISLYPHFDLKLAGELLYGLVFALLFFFVHKKFFQDRFNDRQLLLFSK